MVMATDRTAFLAVPAAGALLLWPAMWNGYPIVFADTGTYLGQAIHRFAGWDRPVFYSLLMLPLHATVTVWPVIVVQAALAGWILWLVCRALLSRVSPVAFVCGAAVLAVATWLPWTVCELMPDVFTPLLVLVVCLLAWVPERLSPPRALGAGRVGYIHDRQPAIQFGVGMCAANGAGGFLATMIAEPKRGLEPDLFPAGPGLLSIALLSVVTAGRVPAICAVTGETRMAGARPLMKMRGRLAMTIRAPRLTWGMSNDPADGF